MGLVMEHLGVASATLLSVTAGAGWCRSAVGLLGGGRSGIRDVGGGTAPWQHREMPAFPLAEEVVPSSAGCVNTGSLCAG